MGGPPWEAGHNEGRRARPTRQATTRGGCLRHFGKEHASRKKNHVQRARGVPMVRKEFREGHGGWRKGWGAASKKPGPEAPALPPPQRGQDSIAQKPTFTKAPRSRNQKDRLKEAKWRRDMEPKSLQEATCAEKNEKVKIALAPLREH